MVFSPIGAAGDVLIVSLATCVVLLAVTRRWRPVIYIATVMVGELGAFLAAAVVMRLGRDAPPTTCRPRRTRPGTSPPPPAPTSPCPSCSPPPPPPSRAAFPSSPPTPCPP